MSEQSNPVRWCLDVSFVYDSDVDAHEDAVVSTVGRIYGDSGAGFGQRDLGFWFDNQADAQAAEARVKAQCSFVHSTHIWNTATEEDE